MTDIYESNSHLPVQYIINANEEVKEEYQYKEDRSIGNILLQLRFYKSDLYQTNQLIHVGHWKPCSNIHS